MKRKSDIHLVSSLISGNKDIVVAAKGEDGAIVALGGEKVVFAADGIIEELIDKDPRWAGYCSILVNVNDLLAMRGRPVAAVNVISAKQEKVLAGIVEGMKEACEKFGVEMVGGHLHPDAAHNDISVAMVGMVGEGGPLLSTTAMPGEAIIVICDCSGGFTPGFPFSWDSTSKKSKKQIAASIDRLLTALSHLSSGKDISNPGLLGTLAMLLESSGVGACVDIEKIPVPEGTELIQWLKAYQGFGFIGTAPAIKLKQIRSQLEGSGISVAAIGKIQRSRQLVMRKGNSEKVLFDLSSEKITGLF